MEQNWCHESCYKWAMHKAVDPKFAGVCHETCNDENCILEHSDYDIDIEG